SQLFKAKELVELFAERYGVPVVGSEIVGLAPMDALVDSAEFYLKLENFSREQILEKRLFAPSPSSLIDMSLLTFSEEVASKQARCHYAHLIPLLRFYAWQKRSRNTERPTRSLMLRHLWPQRERPRKELPATY